MKEIKVNNVFILCVLLAVIVFAVFSSCLNNDYVDFDDDSHFLNNPDCRDLNWKSLGAIFRHRVANTYMPLTTLSFALEQRFFGFNPFISHLINVFLHSLVSVLVFIFSLRLGFSKGVAFLCALIFAVHPMKVESVAWVSERKDVLYSLFYMLAMLRYLFFLKSGRKIEYFFVIVLGLLSMLSKPMAFSLPFTLLLLDYLQGRKITKTVILEKAPFFIYIVPLFLLILPPSKIIQDSFQLESFLIFAWCLSFYLQKFLFPFELIPVYSLPQPIDISNSHYILAVLVAVLFIIAVFRFRRNRLLIFSVLYFLFSLSILLKINEGFVNMVADRYMYLPSLGFCLIFGYYSAKLFEFAATKKIFRTLLLAFYVTVFLLAAMKSYFQCYVWRNTYNLWTYTIQRNPLSPLAFMSRGVFWAEKGNYNLALNDINNSISLYPDYTKALLNRAEVYMYLGRNDLAIIDYTKAISLEPDSRLYFGRGNVYFDKGDPFNALLDFNKAIELNPNCGECFNNRGNVYFVKGEKDLALKDYSRDLEINPGKESTYLNRAALYVQKKEYKKAMQDIEKVIKLNPVSASARLLKAKVEELIKESDENNH
ncbi:MAG: tetratricopeptide repeat protein [Candidatus Omnitrophica bacterium]|nr:tetratricopeptide repeat protein [Candidatus Omnitrophota bacterium]